MPISQDKLVKAWIALFVALAVILVVYGGFVRLSRSGLSIVEWKPVSGALPPLTHGAWQAEFEKYRATPEYLQLNRGMSLAEYRRIFLIEWTHRLVARLAGLVFALPLFAFLGTGRIPWKESPAYLAVGLLFLAQASMGWLMVSSGLIDRPSVSHYLLAAHLLLALSLIGVSTWIWLEHHYGRQDRGADVPWSRTGTAALVALMLLLLQMIYGAFTAGLKAGLVSNTWPDMLGTLVPSGLLKQLQPWILNLVAAPLTVAFIHRWLAVGLLLVAIAIYIQVRKARRSAEYFHAVHAIVGLGVVQICLGIAVVLTRVSMVTALFHQLNAILLFIATIFLLHRVRATDSRPL